MLPAPCTLLFITLLVCAIGCYHGKGEIVTGEKYVSLSWLTVSRMRRPGEFDYRR
jgi:hypothetical protein